jgi:ParB/RepB/Spo0J family partition protein
MAKQRIIRQPDMPMASLGQAAPRAAVEAGEAVPLFAVPSTGDERIQLLPVAKLRPSPYNSRRIRPQKRIDKVADSLAANGQKDPIYVYPGTGVDEGYFMVLGGETRRLAALKNGLSELKAIVDRALDLSNVLLLTKISSILNDSLDECDLDKAMVATSLLNQGHSHSQIAQAFDLESRQHVMRLLKLAALPKEFLDLGLEYPERFSASLGNYISHALERHGEEFALSLLRAALIEQLPHRRIDELIKIGPKQEASGADQGKRLRRDAGFDIKVPNASGGKYVVYKSPKPGQMVLKLSIELPDDLAQYLNGELTEVLHRFIENNKQQ